MQSKWQRVMEEDQYIYLVGFIYTQICGLRTEQPRFMSLQLTAEKQYRFTWKIPQSYNKTIIQNSCVEVSYKEAAYHHPSPFWQAEKPSGHCIEERKQILFPPTICSILYSILTVLIRGVPYFVHDFTIMTQKVIYFMVALHSWLSCIINNNANA